MVSGGVLNRATDYQLRKAGVKPYADISNPESDQTSAFTRILLGCIRRRKNEYLILTAVDLYERAVVAHIFRHGVMLLKISRQCFRVNRSVNDVQSVARS